MESKKLFAFDLDGTLFDYNKCVSEKTINIINGLVGRGHIIAIATARPPRDVIRLLPENLNCHYIICYNGAVIYKGSEKIFEHHIQPELAYRIILELISKQPNLFIGVESSDTFHANRSPAHLFGETDHLLVSFNNSQHPLFKNGITKIICEGLYPAVETYTNGPLNEVCAVTHTDSGSIVQIMALGINKWEALKIVASREEITLNDVISFGDDHNDIVMITSSGIGVAMANSAPALLAVSKHVTASNNEEGVALFLENNFN
jgi:Cof subfamily protein (haloacid dehalogenase superfamily)